MFWALTICIFSNMALSGPLEEWSSISDPSIMGQFSNRGFRSLPASGRVPKDYTNWSGWYWPLKEGGLNSRWTWEGRPGFGHRSPSKTEALNRSGRGLSHLSPSEKFDLLSGRYDYPLKEEVSRNSYPDADDWEGICHGWAAASMNHKEPRPKTLTNADGIKIPFGSSDIKALISYYYANVYQAPDTYQMGRRCDSRSWNRNTDCREDLNAGAFHIVMANRIGLQRKGFLADVDRFREVWNQPIIGYSTKVMGEGWPSRRSAPGTIRELHVSTWLYYVEESGPTWETVIGTDQQIVKKKEYRYRLELDASGDIIGGDWDSDERPDFIWMMDRQSSFADGWEKLQFLLND